MIYRGKVTKVDLRGPYVLVADLHPTQPFGPLDFIEPVPDVGDRVVVADAGSDVCPDLIVIGVVA